MVGAISGFSEALNASNCQLDEAQMATGATNRRIVRGVDDTSASNRAFTRVVRDAAMRKVPLAVVSVLDLPMAARVRGVPMPMPPSYLRARRTRRARPSMTLFGPSRPVRRRLGGW